MSQKGLDHIFAKAEPRKNTVKKKKEVIVPNIIKDDSVPLIIDDEKPVILLSLDPATSTGWSIFEIYRDSKIVQLVHCDFLEIDSKNDSYIGDICIMLQNKIRELINKYNVQEVCVEDYFMSSRKCQGANTNVYLRGSIYILCREIGLHYDIIPVWGWKSFVAGQTTPGKEMKKYYGKELSNKIFIQEALWLRYGIRFPNYSISKNTGKPISLRYDMIDSVGIGLFHIHKRWGPPGSNTFINKLSWPLGFYVDLKTKKKSFQYED